MDTDNDIETAIQELEQMFSDHIDKCPDMLIGEDIQKLKSGLNECVQILLNAPQFLSKILSLQTISDQWELVLKHPKLLNNTAVINAVDRITTIANSEAGCERANSKYNRSKNKLSSKIKLPMILARNRVGGNGPPLHLFEPDPVLYHWKKHHRRLSIKSEETDTVRV